MLANESRKRTFLFHSARTFLFQCYTPVSKSVDSRNAVSNIVHGHGRRKVTCTGGRRPCRRASDPPTKEETMPEAITTYPEASDAVAEEIAAIDRAMGRCCTQSARLVRRVRTGVYDAKAASRTLRALADELHALLDRRQALRNA